MSADHRAASAGKNTQSARKAISCCTYTAANRDLMDPFHHPAVTLRRKKKVDRMNCSDQKA